MHEPRSSRDSFSRCGRRCRPRGLTLTELLIASTIMLLIGAAISMLASTAHSTNHYCRGQTEAAQHARVVLDRVDQAMQNAVASELFPACLVVSEQAGLEALPQCLVVWSPRGAAADPAGLPRVNEIVVFAPLFERPDVLAEIRSPNDATVVPAASDLAGWRALVKSLRASQSVERISLTDRLRTAPLSGSWNASLTASELRGVVRFRRLMNPSDEEWAEYRAGTRNWSDLSWPLDAYRSTSGTRVVVCQTELQMVTADRSTALLTGLPFFGSALRTYELAR
jgi:prepilin-type N-terminal cleavage/methylation domain-containing protein